MGTSVFYGHTFLLFLNFIVVLKSLLQNKKVEGNDVYVAYIPKKRRYRYCNIISWIKKNSATFTRMFFLYCETYLN